MNNYINMPNIHSFDRQSWWPDPAYAPDPNHGKEEQENYEHRNRQ